jgi:hypothetical protein
MIYVANIPLCWHLLRFLFNLNAFGGSSQRGNTFGKSDSPRKASTKDVYGRNYTRYGTDQLPSTAQDSDIEFEEGEFASGRESGWAPEIDPIHLELTPAELRTEWRAKVKAGRRGSSEEPRENKAILKTVEVSQYTS